jgi:hypothetical protein
LHAFERHIEVDARDTISVNSPPPGKLNNSHLVIQRVAQQRISYGGMGGNSRTYASSYEDDQAQSFVSKLQGVSFSSTMTHLRVKAFYSSTMSETFSSVLCVSTTPLSVKDSQ